MSKITDKIRLGAIDCKDHVECWQEYYEYGVLFRMMLSESDVEENIQVLQVVLGQMKEMRKEKGYGKS